MSSSEENADQNGGQSLAPIGDKIHHFERAEKDKLERQEKEMKKALFDRKLSKFTPLDLPPGKNGRRSSEVKQLAQKFQQLPDADKERETRRRKAEFERKRSGFLGSGDTLAADNDAFDSKRESVGKLNQVKMLFEDREAAQALEAEAAERKREAEEEAHQRKKNFESKSSVFEKLPKSE